MFYMHSKEMVKNFTPQDVIKVNRVHKKTQGRPLCGRLENREDDSRLGTRETSEDGRRPGRLAAIAEDANKSPRPKEIGAVRNVFRCRIARRTAT